MKAITTAVISTMSLLGMMQASAHHSFSPVYDGSRSVTVEGVVTEFLFVNPHSKMSLDVTDEAGTTTAWSVEFDGRLNLTNGGWTDQTIKVGERVRVTGNPTHTGSPRLFFMRLQHSDGSVLVRPGVEKIQSIEDERRRRIEQRRQENAGERQSDEEL